MAAGWTGRASVWDIEALVWVAALSRPSQNEGEQRDESVDVVLQLQAGLKSLGYSAVSRLSCPTRETVGCVDPGTRSDRV